MTDNKPRQIKALYDTVRPPREVTDKRIRGQEKNESIFMAEKSSCQKFASIV